MSRCQAAWKFSLSLIFLGYLSIRGPVSGSHLQMGRKWNKIYLDWLTHWNTEWNGNHTYILQVWPFFSNVLGNSSNTQQLPLKSWGLPTWSSTFLTTIAPIPLPCSKKTRILEQAERIYCNVFKEKEPAQWPKLAWRRVHVENVHSVCCPHGHWQQAPVQRERETCFLFYAE